MANFTQLFIYNHFMIEDISHTISFVNIESQGYIYTLFHMI